MFGWILEVDDQLEMKGEGDDVDFDIIGSKLMKIELIDQSSLNFHHQRFLLHHGHASSLSREEVTQLL